MRVKLLLPFVIVLFFLSGAELTAGDTGYIRCPAGEGGGWRRGGCRNQQARCAQEPG